MGPVTKQSSWPTPKCHQDIKIKEGKNWKVLTKNQTAIKKEEKIFWTNGGASQNNSHLSCSSHLSGMKTFTQAVTCVSLYSKIWQSNEGRPPAGRPIIVSFSEQKINDRFGMLQKEWRNSCPSWWCRTNFCRSAGMTANLNPESIALLATNSTGPLK